MTMFGHAGYRVAAAIVSAVSALYISAPASADDAATPGEAVVEQWCRMCHPHASDPPDPVMASSFEEIVRREGRDRAYFTSFIGEDHFPMTTYRLLAYEKAEVVDYLMALQEAEIRRGK